MMPAVSTGRACGATLVDLDGAMFLGACMWLPAGAAGLAIEGVVPAAFFSPVLGEVFELVRSVVVRGEPPTPAALYAETISADAGSMRRLAYLALLFVELYGMAPLDLGMVDGYRTVLVRRTGDAVTIR